MTDTIASTFQPEPQHDTPPMPAPITGLLGAMESPRLSAGGPRLSAYRVSQPGPPTPFASLKKLDLYPKARPCTPSRRSSTPTDACSRPADQRRLLHAHRQRRRGNASGRRLHAASVFVRAPCAPLPTRRRPPAAERVPRAGLFLQVRTDYELNVDTSRGETIQINVRSRLRCTPRRAAAASGAVHLGAGRWA